MGQQLSVFFDACALYLSIISVSLRVLSVCLSLCPASLYAPDPPLLRKMKTTSAPSLVGPILSLLLAGSRLAAAGRDRISATHDGTTFLVDRHDDGRDTPYHVTFLEPFKSVYKFDARGYVTGIMADDETYEVSYNSNGSLQNVRDTALVVRRYLAAAASADEEEKEAEETFEAGLGGGGGAGVAFDDGEILEEGEQEEPSEERSALAGTASHRGRRRRRLYDCVDCEQTWDTLCDQGLETVCDLEDYGSLFGSSAEVSIRLFCDNFSSVCARFSASDVCDGECEEEVEEECLPPLTITLEWSGDATSEESHAFNDALDLYVIEPAGTTVYWANLESVRIAGCMPYAAEGRYLIGMVGRVLR